MDTSCSASARSTSPVMATTPPNADTGSPASAAAQASSSVGRSAAPQGFVCLQITTAGPRIRRPRAAAAEASSTLLYESALPWSGGSPAANGPSQGRGSRSVRRYRAAGWCGFSPYRRVSTFSMEMVRTGGYGSSAPGMPGSAGRSTPASAIRHGSSAAMRASYAAVWRNASTASADRRPRGMAPSASRAARTASYREGEVTIATDAWFLAAARTMLGPPMSISSTSSSNVMPGRRAAAAKGYRLTTTRSKGAIPAASSVSRWSARRRSASRPPWTRGCSVLTRPSSISGAPVTAATSVTGSPASRRARAVPPVETSRNPRATRPRPKSTSPALSETDSSARRGTGIAASARTGSNDARRSPDATVSAPASSAATALGSSRCSTGWIRASSESSVSPARTGTASWATIGPPSRVSSTRWTVTPVTATPAASASRAPWSPGKDGSSEGCTLRTRPPKRRSTSGPTMRR